MKQTLRLALPGDPETITGGYAYDRRLLAELLDAAWDATVLRLPDDFPLPANKSVEIAVSKLADVAPDTALLVDGLALGALPAAAIAGLGRPVVALVHHPLGLEAGLPPETAARLHAGEREALAACAAVVVTSPATARTLVGDFGVPDARITVAVPGTDAMPAATGSGAVPSILAVGTLIPRKGHETLVAALAPLRDRPWTLTIVGGDLDATAAAALRAAIAAHGLADRIRLVGAVDRDRLAGFYAVADVFALLSRYEGYGMAFAEALAAGLPIVACRGGAVPETVPEAAGFMVEPGDVAAASDALAALLDDPALRRRKADAARAAGLRLPSWRQTAEAVAGAVAAVQREAGLWPAANAADGHGHDANTLDGGGR